MTDLTIGDTRFHVVVEGAEDRPALVLSNPLGSDLRVWDTVMPDLARHFRVLRYDVRGHGGTSAPDAPYAIAQLARDVLAIMDALAIDKAHFVGASMSGAIGQWLLVHAPDRIERAVLANTASTFSDAAFWNARIAAARDTGMTPIADAMMDLWFTEAFAAAHGDVVEPIRAAVAATAPAGFAGCCAALRDTDLREAMRHVEHPVLVVLGRQDEAVAPDATEQLAESLPNGELLSLDTRHMSCVEAGPAFAAAVIAFLTGARGSRRAAARKAPPARRAATRAPARRTARVSTAGHAKPPVAAPAKRAGGTAAASGRTRTTAAKARLASARPAPSRTRTSAAKTAARRTKPATAAKPAARGAPKQTAVAKPAKPKAAGRATTAKTATVAKTKTVAKPRTVAKAKTAARTKAAPAARTSNRATAAASRTKTVAAKPHIARKPTAKAASAGTGKAGSGKAQAAKAPARKGATAAAAKTPRKTATKTVTKGAVKAPAKASAKTLTKSLAKTPAKTPAGTRKAAPVARKAAARPPSRRPGGRRPS